MRIGIGQGALGRFGDQRYEKARELGFSTVDFGAAETSRGIYLLSEKAFLVELTAEKELAHRAGIEIYQLHGPWRCPPQDGTPEDRAERMEKMKKAIVACAVLETENMIVHPIMPCGLDDLDTGKAEETWRLNVAFMQELVAFAKPYGVTVCLENMPFTRFSLSKPVAISDVIREVNDERFQMCLDTGHVNVFPELTVAAELKRCREQIRTLHIHDNDGRSDWHQLPYFGTVDWSNVGAALKDVYPRCSFNYETNPPARMPDTVFEAYLKSMVATAHSILG